jgi:ketosteroid isomerase-like protein
MDNAALIQELVERWNAGDLDGSLELFTEDAVMLAGPDWPEQMERRGRDGIRRNMDEWITVWESSRIEPGPIEVFGNKVVGSGTWVTRGRSSGVAGTMPFVILCTLGDGKIRSLEWFTDHDAALAAARGS